MSIQVVHTADDECSADNIFIEFDIGILREPQFAKTPNDLEDLEPSEFIRWHGLRQLYTRRVPAHSVGDFDREINQYLSRTTDRSRIPDDLYDAIFHPYFSDRTDWPHYRCLRSLLSKGLLHNRMNAFMVILVAKMGENKHGVYYIPKRDKQCARYPNIANGYIKKVLRYCRNSHYQSADIVHKVKQVLETLMFLKQSTGRRDDGAPSHPPDESVILTSRHSEAM